MKIKITTAKILIYLPVVLLGCLTLYTACRKQFRPDFQNLPPLSQSARRWFITSIVEKENQMLATADSAWLKTGLQRFARMAKINEILRWDEAKEYSQNGINYVVAPIDQGIKPFKNKKFEAGRSLVFFKDQSGNWNLTVIEVLSKKDAMLGVGVQEFSRTAFLNKQFGKHSKIGNVNATVIFYTEEYKYESSFQFNNGSWSKSNLRIKNKKGLSYKRSEIMSTVAQTTTCSGNCEKWYMVGVWYDMDTGEIIDYEILDEWDSCLDGPIPPPGYGEDPIPMGGNECDLNALQQQANEISASGVAVAENVSITPGSEITGADGEVIRDVVVKWDFYRNSNSVLGYSYKYVSYEDGVHVKVGQIWNWRSITHKTITKVGTSPFETNCTINAATGGISADKLIASMRLDFTVETKISCFGVPVVTSSINDTSYKGDFKANP